MKYHKKTQNFLVISWLFLIPFSHAPGYIHSLITFPGLMVTLLILIYGLPAFSYSFVTNQYKLNLLLIPILTFIVFIFLVFFSSFFSTKLHDKFFNYGFAYIWFFLGIIVFCYLGANSKLSPKQILKPLVFVLFITALFSFFEFYFHFFSIDIGSFILRPDRPTYFFNHPIVGYRIRAFNYESANLAFMANVVFISILILSKQCCDMRVRDFYIALISWMWIVFATWSSAALIMVFPLLCYVFYMKINKFLVLYLFLVLAIIIIYLEITNNMPYLDLSAFDLVYDKMHGYVFGSGKLESASVRNYLLTLGLSALNENIWFGSGLAGFYFYSETGLNNAYLMFGVQFGILGFVFFPFMFISLILYFFIARSLLIAYMNFMALFFLWFVGDFWLPQLFLVFFISFYSLHRKKHV